MSNTILAIPLFILAVVCGPWMLFEAISILKYQRQIVPFPKRILLWMGMMVIGKEKSGQRFGGQDTLQNLRTYGLVTLVFGPALILSGFVYLFWALSK